MGTLVKLKISIFLPDMIPKLKISVKVGTMWVLMGIYGYSCETENFNFSARHDSKLKISVKVGTVWVLMGIYGYSCETENFNFSARNDSKLKEIQ